MRPRVLAIAALLAVVGCVPSSVDARRSTYRAASYSLEIVAGGVPFASILHRGKTWVEGVCNARYSVRITNHTGRRVEVVVSVDGRDVIDGEPADYVSKRGYLLGPYESYDISGFRTSHDTTAAFRFSSVADSYAARRGDSRNVGVIGAAFFPERRAVARPRPIAPRDRRYGAGGMPEPSPAGEELADDFAGEDAPASKAGHGRGDVAERRSRPRPQRLGTGWGETVYSSVVEVDFRRDHQSRPDTVLAVYYDDRAGLIAKGVPLPADCCAPPACTWPSCRGGEPRPFAIPPD